MARSGTEPPEQAPLRRWEREQAQLKANVIEEDTEEWQKDSTFAGLERVGGVDLSYVKGNDTIACASLVVLSYPDLEVLYEDCQMVTVSAPYVAGYLAFREAPFLVEAAQRLQEREPGLRPQVLLVDGNGVLHHRGFGVACHLGVLTGLPCIGVAKNLLQVDGLAKDEQHKGQIRDLQMGGDVFPLRGTSGRVLGMPQSSGLSGFQPSRPCAATTRARSPSMSPWATGRAWSRQCAWSSPAADIRSREYIRKHLSSPLGGTSPGPGRKEEAEPKH
ncbi:endonuclease V isoform X2 [Malaclemys terrapin pileata]|uniref:endonuclease V isoform X2 n=1 Tax=Malaclemys terrapin pileata TaxID=2991368 RepID=UPI0023A8F1AA|nr:endonuclease V isoform X2 [Malaclemys terrapin pileata]